MAVKYPAAPARTSARAPRLAGRPLQALARLLATPVAGRRLADYLMREMLLDRLRRRDLSDAEVRPVVMFRAEPRRPDPAGGGPKDA
ncbi:MAG TPA: hypothetical protein VNO33_02490 [Kofleriaceae bacterium]|nr:hypothetical protein [Kofleriaceae bacterium]